MCNLYSITKGPQAIRDFTHAMRGDVGNMPPLPGVFPDYFAPIVRNAEDGEHELVVARWGMPTPFEILKDKNRDPGVTNIRNLLSPHWHRWLGIENDWAGDHGVDFEIAEACLARARSGIRSRGPICA
jgi:putative SOS response-associated peptidase YedK